MHFVMAMNDFEHLFDSRHRTGSFYKYLSKLKVKAVERRSYAFLGGFTVYLELVFHNIRPLNRLTVEHTIYFLHCFHDSLVPSLPNFKWKLSARIDPF